MFCFCNISQVSARKRRETAPRWVKVLTLRGQTTPSVRERTRRHTPHSVKVSPLQPLEQLPEAASDRHRVSSSSGKAARPCPVACDRAMAEMPS
mmetsp:Transcript_7010/g.18794  ORF Transcript_7010/g.18794 Transcript_7010/m.18794 type:complete len:94 (+) Transcript_7010:1808-2089(+)